MAKKFRSKDFGLDDSSRCGRQKAVDENNLVTSITINRRITSRELALQFNVSQSYIIETLHDFK